MTYLTKVCGKKKRHVPHWWGTFQNQNQAIWCNGRPEVDDKKDGKK